MLGSCWIACGEISTASFPKPSAISSLVAPLSVPAFCASVTGPQAGASRCHWLIEAVHVCRIMIEEPFSALPVDKIAHHLKTDIEEMMEQNHGRLVSPSAPYGCSLF